MFKYVRGWFYSYVKGDRMKSAKKIVMLLMVLLWWIKISKNEKACKLTTQLHIIGTSFDF